MTTVRPFRFGLSLLGFDHGHDWPATALRVESLGYSTLLVPDHFGNQLAPVPALMAAADATTTLRIGSFVFDNDYRHPVVLAKETATLDLLSGGRLEVALGAGWMRSEYEAAGISFDRAPERTERLREAIAVVKGLWSGEPFSYQGQHYHVNGLAGRPLPAQRPGPTLLVGGGGPRMLALAAGEADIVGVAPISRPDGTLDSGDISPGTFDKKVNVVRTNAGPRFADLEINALTFVAEVTGTNAERDEWIDALAQRYGVSPEAVAESPHILVGTVERIVDDLVARRERFSTSYVIVPEPALTAFAPVVEALAGC